MKPNKMFDVVIGGEADRAHKVTQSHDSYKNQIIGIN